MKDQLLEVGDKILVENVFQKYVSTIIRVTKTQAIGDHPSGKVTIKFKRKLWNDSNLVYEVGKDSYRTNTNTLLK